MSNHLNITPPESLLREPLSTPPPTDPRKPSVQVQSIVQFLDCRRAGTTSPYTSDDTEKAFRLKRRDLHELFESLKLNKSLWAYFQDKVRYDYFSEIERFVVRMPSDPHETCVSRIVINIESQLGQLRASGNTTSRAFAEEINYSGSPDLTLLSHGDGHVNKHTPDASFKHSKAMWPGVVIEVAYSQKPKDLDRIAWDYIGGSGGGIQVVIGLNLNYKDKGASLSVWRPSITTEEDGRRYFDCVRTVYQVFVNSDGSASTDEEHGLRLQLRDFAAINAVLSDPDAFLEPVFISYNTLGKITLLARQDGVNCQAKTGETRVLEPDIIIRRRECTPEEEFVSGDKTN